MVLKISKKEIEALSALCLGEAGAGALAKMIGMKKSLLSRVLRRLEEKGLVTAERKGTSKVLRLSPASHAQNFKRLLDSRPGARVEKWLSGVAVDVLITAENGADMKMLLEEVGCSAGTLYKNLKALSAVGAIARDANKIRLNDQIAKAFAVSYAENLEMSALRGVKGRNNSFRMRKHILVRTDAEEVPSFFVETGVSALAKRGLEAMIGKNRDYYFNLEEAKRELSEEEMFVHGLRMAKQRYGSDILLLGLFFGKKKHQLSLPVLKKFAEKYGVENELQEIREKMEFHERAEELK
ncbi:MAG: winged helix-turn-helix domain-containing protein [Candidatus Micrarchaeota archaeon]